MLKAFKPGYQHATLVSLLIVLLGQGVVVKLDGKTLTKSGLSDANYDDAEVKRMMLDVPAGTFLGLRYLGLLDYMRAKVGSVSFTQAKPRPITVAVIIGAARIEQVRKAQLRRDMAELITM